MYKCISFWFACAFIPRFPNDTRPSKEQMNGPITQIAVRLFLRNQTVNFPMYICLQDAQSVIKLLKGFFRLAQPLKQFIVPFRVSSANKRQAKKRIANHVRGRE